VHTRWHIVAAESKHYARVQLLETVYGEIERAPHRHGMKLPDA
jgi:polyphosphate kinase 2 (PPK2 family)